MYTTIDGFPWLSMLICINAPNNYLIRIWPEKLVDDCHSLIHRNIVLWLICTRYRNHWFLAFFSLFSTELSKIFLLRRYTISQTSIVSKSKHENFHLFLQINGLDSVIIYKLIELCCGCVKFKNKMWSWNKSSFGLWKVIFSPCGENYFKTYFHRSILTNRNPNNPQTETKSRLQRIISG